MRQKVSIINMLYCQMLLLPFLFRPSLVIAYDESRDWDRACGDRIILEGLSLPCRNCRIDEGGNCEIETDGERLLLSPSKAIDILLSEVVRRGYHDCPKPTEIFNFLLRDQVAGDRARILFSLLFKTSAGRRLFVGDVSRLARTYKDIIPVVLASEEVDRAMLMEIWHLPVTPEIPADAKMRITAARIHGGISLEEIIGELTVSDLEKDLVVLRAYDRVFAVEPDARSGKIRFVLQWLEECVTDGLAEVDKSFCSRERLAENPEVVSAYLERALIQKVIREIRTKNPSPGRVLEMIRGTAYRRFRTPEMHEVLLQALKKSVSEGAAAEQDAISVRENRTLLEEFSSVDAQIAEHTAQVYSLVAQEKHVEGDIDAAVALLDASLRIYPENLTLRNKVIALLSRDLEAVSQSNGGTLVAQLIRRGIEADQSRRRKYWRLTALSLLGFILLAHRQLFGTCRAVSESKDHFGRLDQDERDELIRLLRMFRLPHRASERELTRAFHKLAKKNHPDLADKDSADFAAVSACYSRARELLRKI